MKRKLLYVDDQPENLVVFRAAFEEDFKVLAASSGAEALEALAALEIPVIVADQRMPEMTGVELFHVVRREYPHTIRMLLTGYTDPDAMIEAINGGHVYSYVTKPWEPENLFGILLRGFEAYDLAVANNALTERLDHTERLATLGRRAASVAHEMRNQLFILPLLEMIEESYQADNELMELARISRQTHDRLVELINEVMDCVRKDHETHSKIPLNLGDLAREAISLARLDKNVPKHSFRLDVRDEPLVCCNKAKVQQAIFNLLRNAIEAVRSQEKREIVITVGLEGSDAVLSVSDNGPGIDPDHLEKIWEPFFSTKGRDGNGLGLDLCRRIVEAHDGKMVCHSRPGEGTMFAVRLPVAEGAEAVDS